MIEKLGQICGHHSNGLKSNSGLLRKCEKFSLRVIKFFQSNPENQQALLAKASEESLIVIRHSRQFILGTLLIKSLLGSQVEVILML